MAAAFASCQPALAQTPAPPQAIETALNTAIDGAYPELGQLYEWLHANPELAGSEHRTAARLASEMRRLGLTVTEGIGSTGLVAVYENGPGPTLLIRTELDGLPMRERTGLSYASRATADVAGEPTPVMHGCGHDIHMAAWVGTARALVALKSAWRGRVLFVAQPAEETLSGARQMLADDLFSRFGRPDQALALHAAPLAHGTVAFRSGPIMSAANNFEIVFLGRGGHGAAPHLAIDPVLMGARFTVDVQSLVSRETDPGAFGVVTVGAIQAGTVGNIIPDRLTLRGTIRSYDEATRARLVDGVRRIALASARMSGAPEPRIEIDPGTGALVNDADIAATVAQVFREAFGSNAIEIPPVVASDDFSEFGRAGIPSFYFFIGVYDRAGPGAVTGELAGPANHSPEFAPVPEPTIKTGVRAMTLAALALMNR